MIVVRDIAGIALPFAAGIMASIYFSFISILPPALPLMATALCLITLTHPQHKRLSSSTLRALIIIASLSCGIFSGLSDTLSCISPGKHENILTGLLKGIPFESSQTTAIVSALITGDRRLLSSETIEIFRTSGASHILALSGLHLGIIYGTIRLFLKLFGNNPAMRRIRSIILISACSFYTFATGSGPSTVRALLFIFLGEAAVSYGLFRSTGSFLMAAMFIQLAYTPASAGHIGFQLSYAAMAGIAFIYPRLRQLWPEGGGLMKWMWNSASMSIACQITTGPLAYLYFGTFPQYFLLTNMMALPLVGIIIPANLLVLLLNSLNICPAFLIKAVEWLTLLMTDILKVIASL